MAWLVWHGVDAASRHETMAYLPLPHFVKAPCTPCLLRLNLLYLPPQTIQNKNFYVCRQNCWDDCRGLPVQPSIPHLPQLLPQCRRGRHGPTTSLPSLTLRT